MEKNAKIYVAGHRGLVGSALCQKLHETGYSRLVLRSHAELNLLDGEAVRQFFDEERPEYVFLAAAFVGGILANSRYRADFIYRNLAIQQHVLGESFRYGVKKLLFLGSSCIYPRLAPQPLAEDCLLTSPLEYSNEPYAIAKIAGLKMCESFNLQYGTEFLAVMPTNLYGPNDNFDLERSHLLPAILRKMHLAHLLRQNDFASIRLDLSLRPIRGIDICVASECEITATLEDFGITAEELRLWGTGTPLRELMWSLDMADACLFVMNEVSFEQLCPTAPSLPTTNCHINVGTGREHTIAEIAELIRQEIGFDGCVSFDGLHPDGTPRKLLDVSNLSRLGWRSQTTLESGIPVFYRWYRSNIRKE